MASVAGTALDLHARTHALTHSLIHSLVYYKMGTYYEMGHLWVLGKNSGI